MSWIIQDHSWFLFLAYIFSIFWGCYGICEDIQNPEGKQWSVQVLWIKEIGVFIAEFVCSFAGWYCLYVLVENLLATKPGFAGLGGADIFLIIIAIIGISGNSYQVLKSVGSYLSKK